MFGHFVHFWAKLALFGRSWVKIGDWGHPHTPNWVEASAKTYSNVFHANTTVLDQQSSVIFGQFWTFLGHFGHPWAKIWDTLHTDTLPAVSKPQPRHPVTLSIPFQPFGTTRVLKVRFWPFSDHFGPFWGLLDQNWGDPCTPNKVKTSTRTSCNLFHAVPTVLDHQSAPARALKPTRIIGHKNGHFG